MVPRAPLTTFPTPCNAICTTRETGKRPLQIEIIEITLKETKFNLRIQSVKIQHNLNVSDTFGT